VSSTPLLLMMILFLQHLSLQLVFLPFRTPISTILTTTTVSSPQQRSHFPIKALPSSPPRTLLLLTIEAHEDNLPPTASNSKFSPAPLVSFPQRRAPQLICLVLIIYLHRRGSLETRFHTNLTSPLFCLSRM
jgi:hypothetical protein